MNRTVYSVKKKSKFKILFPVLGLLTAGAVFFAATEIRPGRFPAASTSTKADVARVLGKRLVTASRIEENDLTVDYSVDQRLQQAVEQTLKRGKVPYGAFVAMDARTGQVLAMVSHGMKGENLGLRASYPAASIFKIITAAAALESHKFTHDSMIPVLGSFHTLYKRNVLKGGGIYAADSPRYARLISFEDALAKSVNSVFGKVGLFGVGTDGLRKIAARFQFGKDIPFELPLDQDTVMVPEASDQFGIAESASGYTRHNTLNPLHGALIAAAVANDGVMMEPSIVNRALSKDGKLDYTFQPKPLLSILEKPTADELSMMMHRTIVMGTSRRAFRNVSSTGALNEVYIAGKTGTLNGWSPPGRYDWFVGFGQRDGVKIAVSALCIHGSRRGVKASQVARAAFEAYFGTPVTVDTAKNSTLPVLKPAEAIQHVRHIRRHRRHHHTTV